MSSFTAHPMLTPHDDTMIAWQQACTQAADVLRPQHDRERLAKALALAHEGAVTLDDDGAPWSPVMVHATALTRTASAIARTCRTAVSRASTCWRCRSIGRRPQP